MDEDTPTTAPFSTDAADRKRLGDAQTQPDSSEFPESWESCYDRLAPRLVLFARQWLRNSQDAEDAVQEAFVRVWKQQQNHQQRPVDQEPREDDSRSWESHETDKSFADHYGGVRHYQDAYYFAATRTAAIDHVRRTSRRELRETTAMLQDGSPDAGAGLGAFGAATAADGTLQYEPASAPPPALCAQDIEDALGAIPQEQREAVVLRIWGGQSFAEIAQISGVAIDTAASRYRYGIAAMKKYFNLTTP